MVKAGWAHGEILRSRSELVAADNMAQKSVSVLLLVRCAVKRAILPAPMRLFGMRFFSVTAMPRQRT